MTIPEKGIICPVASQSRVLSPDYCDLNYLKLFILSKSLKRRERRNEKGNNIKMMSIIIIIIIILGLFYYCCFIYAFLFMFRLIFCLVINLK